MANWLVGLEQLPADAGTQVVAWMDLRGAACASLGAATALFACLLGPEQAAHARQAGIPLIHCATLPMDRAAALVLDVASNPDEFAHYRALESIVTALPDPADALAPLAHLCLHSAWPLAENAWIWLERCARPGASASTMSGLAWCLLQLRLSTVPPLRTMLISVLEEASPSASNGWRCAFETAWERPWCDEGWILRMTRQQCWRDADEALVPITRWLSLIESARAEDLVDLEPLLGRRNTSLLLADATIGGDGRLRFEAALNQAYRVLLCSSDEWRVRVGVRWAERFGGVDAETGERLLCLSDRLPEALRQDSAWTAFRQCWGCDLRLRIVQGGYLSAAHLEQLCCSLDPDSDWIGYSDEQSCRWLVDPLQLYQDLHSHADSDQWDALQWISVFPFPALEDRVTELAPSRLRERVLEIYRRRRLAVG